MGCSERVNADSFFCRWPSIIRDFDAMFATELLLEKQIHKTRLYSPNLSGDMDWIVSVIPYRYVTSP